MKEYSKIYYSVENGKQNKLFGYRYNYKNNTLEYISKYDFRKNPKTGEWEDVTLEEWQVVTSIGLDLENWNDNPEYWIEQYTMEINKECRHEAKYL